MRLVAKRVTESRLMLLSSQAVRLCVALVIHRALEHPKSSRVTGGRRDELSATARTLCSVRTDYSGASRRFGVV